MTTFHYDPEAGDKVVCEHCGGEGYLMKVLRGTMHFVWKIQGSPSQDQELKWSKSVKCAFCGVETKVKRVSNL